MHGIRILVADPDPRAPERLGPALRRAGHRLQVVADGNRALEAAILGRPDLVLIDEACPFVDAAAFAGILRANPRTASIPVAVQGARAPEGTLALLPRPAPAERLLELAARIGGDRDALAELTEGRLAHLSIVDLLQVFAMNRRSGRLLLRFPDASAEIVLVEGRIHDARGPRVRGEKALYRFLPRVDGSFEFRPGELDVPDAIGRSVDAILLEAMRQGDELALVQAELPPPPFRLALGRAPADPGEGIERELAAALAAGPLPLDELLDRSEAADLDVARAALAMLGRGALRAERDAGGEDPKVLALLREGRRRVLLLGVEPERLPGLRPVEPRPPLGLAGTLALAPGAELELVLVPADRAWLPFAAAVGGGALGAIAGEGTPRELEAAAPRCEPAGDDPAAALRRLLAAAANGS